MSTTETVRILSHEPVGTDAFHLKLTRPSWSWKAGELVSLSGNETTEVRDYTIASGENEETLDVLYRLIPSGRITPQLTAKLPGECLDITGPYGRFTIRDTSRPILFCATGTGLAPCRAYLRSHPGLHLHLLHGVRCPSDLYFREELQTYPTLRYQPFCTREWDDSVHQGRITSVLPSLELADDVHIYLCGANEMIYEAEEILLERGIPQDCIFHEPYYYRLDD